MYIIPKPLLRIEVEREENGAYFASWEGEGSNGVGGYSATRIGAVANALHTLILALEDRELAKRMPIRTKRLRPGELRDRAILGGDLGL